MARPYYEAKLLSQYGKNFRGCLCSVKAIIGPKVEDKKDFRAGMQKKENRKNRAVVAQSVIEGVIVNEAKVYRTFKESYPFYLSEHANRISRRLQLYRYLYSSGVAHERFHHFDGVTGCRGFCTRLRLCLGRTFLL